MLGKYNIGGKYVFGRQNTTVIVLDAAGLLTAVPRFVKVFVRLTRKLYHLVLIFMLMVTGCVVARILAEE